MRPLYYTSLLLLFSISCSLTAQQITDARTIHPQDSGLLTAGAFDAAGNLYLASLMNEGNPPGETGISGIFPSGAPVLSKYAPDGSLLWRHAYPGNIARFSDLAITPEQNVVVTGGYVDTFFLGTNGPIPGEATNSSFFIAQLNPAGEYLWIDTDVSALPEDCMGWALAVGPAEIYVTGLHEGITSSLRRYGFDGGLQSEKIVDIRTISDLIWKDGQLYVMGTAAPESGFNGFPVPAPPQETGYANYIARLDTSFQVQWMHTTSYITFDMHPRGAVFNGLPILFSNDFDNGPHQENVYRLKTYSPEGDLIRSDSILGGFNFLDYEHFALQTFCDRLLLVHPVQHTFVMKSFDSAYQDTLLVQSSSNSFSGSYPIICTSAGRAVFGSGFRDAELLVGDSFSLHNNHPDAPQQFLVEMECESTTGIFEEPASPAVWSISPNPASSVVYLQSTANQPEQEVSLQLLDVSGRIHWQGKSAAPLTAIPIAHVPGGVYFLRIAGKKTAVTLKGIKN